MHVHRGTNKRAQWEDVHLRCREGGFEYIKPWSWISRLQNWANIFLLFKPPAYGVLLRQSGPSALTECILGFIVASLLASYPLFARQPYNMCYALSHLTSVLVLEKIKWKIIYFNSSLQKKIFLLWNFGVLINNYICYLDSSIHLSIIILNVEEVMLKLYSNYHSLPHLLYSPELNLLISKISIHSM